MTIRVGCASAATGARKTTLLMESAAHLARDGERVIVLAPTKLLVDQIVEDMAKNHPDVLVTPAYESRDMRHPTGWLLEHARSAVGREPQVVVTTHAALPFLLDMERRREWHLMLDEALQVVRLESRRVPLTHRLFTDEVRTGEVRGRFVRLLARSESRIRELSRAPDDLLRALAEPYRLLASKGVSEADASPWEVWVHVEGYRALLEGHDGDGEFRLHDLADGDGALDLHAVMKPEVLEGWASVFVAGACLEHTEMHRVWSRRGVMFVPDEGFRSRLAFDRHECGPTMQVRYATERNLSRGILHCAGGDGVRNLDRLARATLDHFDGDFLYSVNERERQRFEGWNAWRGTRAPHVPHGLNDFAHLDDVVSLSSLNPTPTHWAFLRDVAGMTDDEVRRDHADLPAYQLVGRSSIRDLTRPDARRRVIVTALHTAEFLAEQFPGVDLDALPGVRFTYPTERPRGRPRSASPSPAALCMRRLREGRRVEAARRSEPDPGELDRALEEVSARPRSWTGARRT